MADELELREEKFQTVADTGEPGANAGDGRRLRRDRNRTAVVDALLDLYTEGNLSPSTEEITRRAGLSPRSLFRYFDDVDDLAGTAITQAHARVAPLAELNALPTDPLVERIAVLADQRCELFEAVESVALVTRLRAPFSLVVAKNLAVARAHLRSQVADLFAPELSELTPAVAVSRLAALDVICSFEAYRLLRDDQALDRAEARQAIVQSLTDLLPVTPT